MGEEQVWQGIKLQGLRVMDQQNLAESAFYTVAIHYALIRMSLT